MKKHFVSVGLFISVLLVSCQNGDDPITLSVTPPTITFSTFDESTLTSGLTPNSGDVKMLVVPVQFNEDPHFTNNQLNRIEVSFNGEGEEKLTPYWESVSSYYSKSSYGKLNLEFVMTDIFTSTVSKYDFTEDEYLHGPSANYGSIRLLNDMYNNLTIDGQAINYQDYDSDKDGYVDGIWLVYNSGTDSEVFGQFGHFWAYTYYLQNEANVEKPVFNTYANGSQLFFNRDTGFYGYDSHTMIHETGHMLGLEDYYSSDGEIYDASGGLMMMNLNIGDHDSFSKYSLGWVSPHIIKEDEEITIKPFNESGDVLIIPSESYEEEPFSEYLIIEYYTPTGLNEYDSQHRYGGTSGSLLYNESGILVYHVDSRLVNLKNNSEQYEIINDIKSYNFNKYDPNDYVSLGTSNTPSYSIIDDGAYHLLEIVTNDNRPLFNYNFSNNSSLFKVGNTFNPKTLSNYFTDGQFHDGSSINFTFEVKDINDKGATLSFSHI